MTHELPLPNYDDLPVESIGSRARTLDESSVRTLLDYERSHADRPAVVQLLKVRLNELSEGVEPTGGSPAAPAPEAGTPGDAPAQPAVKEGPPVNPPRHGTPENPGQPRS